MEDRESSDAESALDKYDQNDGQRPVKGTDKVLITKTSSQKDDSPPVDENLCEEDLNEDAGDSVDYSSVDINELIDAQSQFLFGYAYRLTSSVSDAEDLTQQTFLIAHQKLDQLRSPSAAKSWLCAILRSCWLKSIRRTRPSPACNFEFELSELVAEESSEVEIDAQAIRQAIQELPPDYRLVLLMYYFEELSYQQIAEKLQIKIGTVMSRLSRAKDRVRRRLHNKDDLLDQ